jgi:NADPH:quinone reductase-like Zn-dependent oxidoreductase
MRTRTLEERIPLVRDFADRVLPLFEAERRTGGLGVRPIVGATYPMSDIAEAHAAMEADENFGKIVLVW